MSRPPQPIKHGTYTGYLQHRRRKEDACLACRMAWADYFRMRRQNK